jgi:hypothetical protein
LGKEVVRILEVAVCDGFLNCGCCMVERGRGNVLMELIVRVGLGLVMLLLYAVGLRFVLLPWWVLVAIVPVCRVCCCLMVVFSV